MHKYQKKNNNLIKNIIKYINSDVKFKSSFYHHCRIYKLNVLLKCIIDILMSGLSFRQYKQISNCKCPWKVKLFEALSNFVWQGHWYGS